MPILYTGTFSFTSFLVPISCVIAVNCEVCTLFSDVCVCVCACVCVRACVCVCVQVCVAYDAKGGWSARPECKGESRKKVCNDVIVSCPLLLSLDII